MHPLFILAIGIAVVIGMIVVVRTNAFIALITSAIVVSLLAPGPVSERITRVAEEFGKTAGNIGIVIALAVVIGKCMMDSGAADRIVRGFLSLLGEKRSATALMASGYVLSIPVFFDTVFYLLVPLARSMTRRTGRYYIKYALAIVAGGVVTHSLVPPTPGPLFMAENLGLDIGVMILAGVVVAVPASIVGIFFAGWCDRRMKMEMRPISGGEPEPEPLEDRDLPPLLLSLLPVVLPVILISTNTVCQTLADAARERLLAAGEILEWSSFCGELGKSATDEQGEATKRVRELLSAGLRHSVVTATEYDAALQGEVAAEVSLLVRRHGFLMDPGFAGVGVPEDAERLLKRKGGELSTEESERVNWLMLEAAFPRQVRRTAQREVADVTAVLGDVNLAMLGSAVIAMWMLKAKRGLALAKLGKVVEVSLMSGGVIILITAAGGAFGAMLKAAQVGPAIEGLFGGEGGSTSGVMLLVLGAVVATVMKIAQGSTTVAMITASGMIAAMIPSMESLGYHPAYLATAIGGGAMIGSWMNDSGFWIFVKMMGLTEAEGIKSWTPMLAIVGIVAVVVSVLLAVAVPMG